MEHVDLYCERLAPGLWAEPVNAVTNFAFLIAAGALVWLFIRSRHPVPVSVWLLPVTTAVVGLCSLAFHTFATGFTGMLDSLSIAVFILLAAVVAVQQIWGVDWRWAWLAAPAAIAVVAVTSTSASTLGVRSALGSYLGALVVLIGFGLAFRRWAPAPTRRFSTLLFGAAAVFATSLTLRTLDGPLCSGFPLGTHFLWHCLNATVLFLVGYAVFRCSQVRSVRTGSSG